MHKLFNLGCKLNQYEGFCLLEKFLYIEDLVIVNTCCVTKEAEVKSFKKYRHAIKKFPKSYIIVTGCLCKLYPEKFSQAHQVIDTTQRNHLIRDVFPAPEKSRYFLKIEDGCNGVCTFCIVSKVRSTIESKPLTDIEKEINWAVSCGYKEIVLVGANIGLYGIDVGLRLTDLLKMLKKVSNLPRVRLSSIEPQFINAELVEILKELPFCRHFHIPIQSADDLVLCRMGRNYDVFHLKKIIDLIRKNFVDVAISGDVIVGFPGEGEEEFLNTYTFVESHPFTHLHIFRYSPRPGTEALTLGDPVPYEEKKRRLWRLKILIAGKNYQFRKGLLNEIFDIIVEKNNGIPSGLTDNYIRVEFDGDYGESSLLHVKITDVTEDRTVGDVVNASRDN